ncbi:MAG: insulinase family protein [Bacteroidaceae bacterium]|nr:insulinase family protein [Bacteroidaceae bacterium]
MHLTRNNINLFFNYKIYLMKKLIIAAALFCNGVLGATAQNMNIPADPEIKKGTLPNGLTYYIRHNEWPEKRAFFYIAQNVGSMQEDDNQRGLAHFLEHMCFNGTKNFQDDRLKKYLETIGVKFGENLNAYTSFDETVYNIDNVNVEVAGAIDSCLYILHDWSHDLTLNNKEIDKERGVINEEWRMRSSAQQRMMEKALPEMYPGSKYANRMPIGTMEIVMNFPYQTIKDYYKKWYRPDLQAIVIVGDVDVNVIEEKIKTIFADIKPVENAAVREYYPVPDNKEPIVSIQKDKEQQYSIMNFFWKTDGIEREMKSTVNFLLYEYVKDAVSTMFSLRIYDILQKENAPFIQAQLGLDNFFAAKTKDAVTGSVVFKDNGDKEAIKGLYREILRASRFGFTVSEYERYKAEYLSQLEKEYQRRDKINSKSFVNQCVRNYLDNEPMNNIEWEYTMMNQIVPNIPITAINQAVSQMIPDSNLVILGMFPDKDGIVYPTKEKILEYMKEVEAEQIEAYKEEVNTDPLISELPKASKIKSIKDEMFGSKLITLKNGIKIHVKKTDFAPNQISMQAVSWGGSSLYSDDEYIQVSNAETVSEGGIGNFSATELNKKLAGIQANCDAGIDTRSEYVSGSCVKKDLETMLQLMYLRFTSPRRDDEVYKSIIKRSKDIMMNQELNPMTAFRDTIAKTLYNDNIRARRTRPADLDKINFDRCMEIYKERFADGDDFEFYFVGDIDADTVAPLLAKYIGALPVLKGSEKYKTIDNKLNKGTIKNVFEKEQETPNAIVLFVFNAPFNDDLNTVVTFDALEYVTQTLFTQTVREDEGGAYSVGVGMGLRDYPEAIGIAQIQLPTAPEKRAHMTEIVYKGIDNLVNNGPAEEEVQKAKEYLLRSHKENLKKNEYWMGQLQSITRENKNYVDGYEEAVNNITVETLKAAAKKLFKSGNCIEVGMTSPIK